MEKNIYAIVFAIVITSGILSFGVHELAEYAQAKQHPWVEPVNFTGGYPQMGWSMEWQFDPTSEQIHQFLEESEDWHRNASIVQLFSIPVIFVVMIGLRVWWENR